jgi:1-acyl-sn-glycerol-3-phosphate acyltransferase
MYGISVLKILVTVYFWFVAAISLILTLIVCLFAYPFVDQKTFARIYEYVFCNLVLYAMTTANIWSFKITDKRKPENRHFKDRYVLVANHVSFIDTLVVGMLPLKKKYIMAKIFAKIPVFGWLCSASGHIMVDDKDRSTTKPAVELSINAIKDGSSLFVYPEGRRSKDPNVLLPFKTGAFRIAKTVNLPILPIALRGTAKGMKIGGICKPADLEIIIGDPIDVNDNDITVTINKVRDFIKSELDIYCPIRTKTE